MSERKFKRKPKKGSEIMRFEPRGMALINAKP